MKWVLMHDRYISSYKTPKQEGIYEMSLINLFDLPPKHMAQILVF